MALKTLRGVKIAADIDTNDVYLIAADCTNIKLTDKSEIGKLEEELATQEISKTLYNSKQYPFNDSKDTIALSPPRETLDYTVETSLDSAAGNPGDVVISDKQLNGFKVEFTGSASSVVVRCKIRGGIISNLPPLGTELDACTWQQISDISRAGLAANYFAVGDCKAVYLSGTIGTLDIDETYYVYILGFDHNREIEGRGISFGCFKTAKIGGKDICLIDGASSPSDNGTKCFNMNHSGNINTGGWQGCDLRFDILGSVDVNNTQNASANTPINPVADTLMAALPADLRAVMKPIIKYTDNYGQANNNDPDKVTTTVDYLPLLSEFEIFGARSYANSKEQTYQQQYAYYLNGNSKLKYKHNNNASAVHTWGGRSSVYNSPASFSSVYGIYTPTSAATGVYYSTGLSPVFLI